MGLPEALELVRAKRYPEAMLKLERMLEQNPGVQPALLLKSHILLHNKEYAAAQAAARQVLEGDAWSTDAMVLLGLAAKWTGQAKDALHWFRLAVYARFECWPAHYYLAGLYRGGQDVGQARRSYRAVLQLLANDVGAGDGLAVIPLGLPESEVRFLCQHQLSLLERQDGDRSQPR